MQPIPGVLQHLVDAPAVKTMQIGFEILAHLVGCGPCLTWQELIVLVDVGIFQCLEFTHRVVQASRRHAPGANRGADQIHRLGAARQPLAKQVTVHGTQDQALGAACSPGDHADVLRQQAMLGHVGPGFGTSVNLQGFHNSTELSACSVGRQGVIGLTTL